MEVKEVNDQTSQQAFLNVCKEIYRGDPSYVRPLDNEIESIFDPTKNAFFEEGEAKRWVLYDDRRVIGRIAAFINDGKVKSLNKYIGGIGFFECIDDEHAAHLLFDVAVAWLRKHDIAEIDGPINFGENNNYWGLLTEGFVQPAYGMNYNPPYYKSLFESYGFEPLYEQYTNHFDLQKPLPDRFRKIVKKVLNNEQYYFEHFKPGDADKYIRDFTEIYNSAWVDHEGFQPIKEDYIRLNFEQMKPVMVPEMIWFAYAKCEPVGFVVTLPDANQIIKHLNGKMNVWSIIKFLWFKYTGAIDRVRVIIMGIKPEYRRKGLESGLVVKSFDAMKSMKLYKTAELSWVGDFNPAMMALYKASGAAFGKKHITYRKRL